MKNAREIKFATDDVTVYLAAAGAGKTSAIIAEMTELLKTYRPDEIAFVTFTRKGVLNGIERALMANPQLSADDLVYFRTLHALCFRELGLKHDSIIKRSDIAKFNEKCGGYFHLALNGAFDKQNKDDELLSLYDARRNDSTEGIFVWGHYDDVRYDAFVKAYEKFKKDKKLVDFHDCLLKFRERNKPVNVKAAFIDEAQDLTRLQWEVCQTAFSAAEKIYIAGDDFQSLFTYAGASPKTLISLSQRYRTVKLETSYRLPKSVYRFSKGITKLIGDKIDKDFRPVKDIEGFVKKMDDRHQFMCWVRKDMKDNGITPSRWYLLFRNNCFIGETAELLEQYVIPYHSTKGFCIPEKDLIKIKRFYNYRKQGFGSKDAFEKFCKDYNIKDINEDFTESDLIPSERRYVYFGYVQEFGIEALAEMANKEPFILLSTTHRVKGGEVDFVAVFLDCTRRVDENMMANIDEELRVLYVACTRAKTGLFLIPGRTECSLNRVIDVIKEQAV
jgi:superfamily I DNA/RNA helicase